MKIKFKNSTHRTTFSAFVFENIKSPFCSRNEFIAAVFCCPQIRFCGDILIQAIGALKSLANSNKPTDALFRGDYSDED